MHTDLMFVKHIPHVTAVHDGTLCKKTDVLGVIALTLAAQGLQLLT